MLNENRPGRPVRAPDTAPSGRRRRDGPSAPSLEGDLRPGPLGRPGCRRRHRPRSADAHRAGTIVGAGRPRPPGHTGSRRGARELRGRSVPADPEARRSGPGSHEGDRGGIGAAHDRRARSRGLASRARLASRQISRSCPYAPGSAAESRLIRPSRESGAGGRILWANSIAFTQREQELFHACLDLPPAQRDAYLEQACGADPPLLARAARLLAAHARAEQGTLSPPLHALIPEDLPGLHRPVPTRSRAGRRGHGHRLRGRAAGARAHGAWRSRS